MKTIWFRHLRRKLVLYRVVVLYWGLNLGFTLARQVVHLLSHTPEFLTPF
jgi:hypothetical protein